MIIRVCAGELLRIGEDKLLARMGGDREHTRTEALAGVVLEQRGVLAAMEKVLEHAARRLALNHLALLP